MSMYGYNRDHDEATEARVLSQVTFQFCPEDLRRVASFLIARANEIEAGTFINGGRHLRDHDKRWSAEEAGDVVVVPPQLGEAK